MSHMSQTTFIPRWQTPLCAEAINCVQKGRHAPITHDRSQLTVLQEGFRTAGVIVREGVSGGQTPSR
jgi:hypothetical protein